MHVPAALCDCLCLVLAAVMFLLVEHMHPPEAQQVELGTSSLWEHQRKVLGSIKERVKEEPEAWRVVWRGLVCPVKKQYVKCNYVK